MHMLTRPCSQAYKFLSLILSPVSFVPVKVTLAVWSVRIHINPGVRLDTKLLKLGKQVRKKWNFSTRPTLHRYGHRKSDGKRRKRPDNSHTVIIIYNSLVIIQIATLNYVMTSLRADCATDTYAPLPPPKRRVWLVQWVHLPSEFLC